jgi:hypothetical protein
MTIPTPETFYAAFEGITKDPYERWHSKPLSWSQLSCWEQSHRQWFERYVLGKKGHSTKYMTFGNWVGDEIARNPAYLPQIPRLPHFEYTIETTFNRVPLIAHIDNYAPLTVHEFKTAGVHWTQRQVDKHRQLDCYLAMLYVAEKIKPEDVTVRLFSIPTTEVLTVDEHGTSMDLAVLEDDVRVFETKRTTMDILKFLGDCVSARKSMELYAKENI